jgi:hypothetical protein
MAGTARGQVDAEFALFTADADPAGLGRLLPPGMVPTGRILVYLGWMQERAMGGAGSLSWPFHEFGLCIGAREPHSSVEAVLHEPLYVDDPLASIRGGLVTDSRRLADIQVEDRRPGAGGLGFTVNHDARTVVSGSLRDQRPVSNRDFPLSGTRLHLQRTSGTPVDGQSTATGGLQRVRLDFFPSGTTGCAGDIDIRPQALGGIDIGPLERVRGFTGRCKVVLHPPGTENDLGAKPWSLTA